MRPPVPFPDPPSPPGEEGGPEYVWQAIKVLGAQRIDHGIRSLEDPELVEYMAAHAIPITLCPISNQKLQVCSNTCLLFYRRVRHLHAGN